MGNIKALEATVKKFCEERDWDKFHNPKDLAIGISTEANELLDIFRFKTDEDIRGIFKCYQKNQHVEEEIADVFFFLLRFTQMYGIDIEKALNDKIKKNAEKYPIDKSKGKNLKYTEI